MDQSYITVDCEDDYNNTISPPAISVCSLIFTLISTLVDIGILVCVILNISILKHLWSLIMLCMLLSCHLQVVYGQMTQYTLFHWMIRMIIVLSITIIYNVRNAA